MAFLDRKSDKNKYRDYPKSGQSNKPSWILIAMAIMEEQPRQERRNEMKPEYSSVDELPLVMSVPQLAKLLGIGRNAAYDIVNSGGIRSIKIGRTIRIPKSAVIEFIEHHGS